MLKEGDKIPDLTLSDQDGESVALKDFAGKTVVLYFYPKDSTPGCTTEACGFRDGYASIQAKGAVVVGVSADSVKSHRNFADKQRLPFTLLSDPERVAIKAFGAWGEKKMYGKVYEGILRSTFVIGPDGIVKKVFPKVSPATHAQEIIAYL